eukprot:9680753-Karenia_brevis.AAC.1
MADIRAGEFDPDEVQPFLKQDQVLPQKAGAAQEPRGEEQRKAGEEEEVWSESEESDESSDESTADPQWMRRRALMHTCVTSSKA